MSIADTATRGQGLYTNLLKFCYIDLCYTSPKSGNSSSKLLIKSRHEMTTRLA